MSTPVEFVLRAKDELSGPLNKAAGSANQATTATDKLREAQIKQQAEMRAQAAAFHANRRAQEKAQQATRKSSLSIKQLEDRLKHFRKQRGLVDSKDVATISKYNREITHLENKLKGLNSTGIVTPAEMRAKQRVEQLRQRKSLKSQLTYGNAGTGILSGLMGRSNIIAAGALVAGALARKIVVDGMRSQYDRVRMTNEFGARGSTLMNGLNRHRGSLGDGAVEHGVQLAASGMSNKQTFDTLRRLGAVANGSADKLSDLTDTMASINKEGKLTEESMKSLDKNGLRPLELLNRTTGESFRSLFDRLEKGKITAHEVTQALNAATNAGGEFAGNLDRLDGSTLSNWRELGTIVSNMTGNLGENLLDKLGFGPSKDGGKPAWLTALSLLPDMLASAEKATGLNLGFLSNLGTATAPTNTRQGVGNDMVKAFRDREYEKAKEAEEARKKREEQLNAVSGGGARSYTFNITKMIETINNKFEAGDIPGAADSVRRSLEEQLARLLGSISATVR